jgi:apolipoprotein N-acyltransferase
VISALKLGEMGVLDARLPKALEQSTYARYGDLAFILLLVGAALTAWILGRI